MKSFLCLSTDVIALRKRHGSVEDDDGLLEENVVVMQSAPYDCLTPP